MDGVNLEEFVRDGVWKANCRKLADMGALCVHVGRGTMLVPGMGRARGDGDGEGFRSSGSASGDGIPQMTGIDVRMLASEE